MLRDQSARRPSGKVVKVVSSCMGIFGLVVWCVGPFFFGSPHKTGFPGCHFGAHAKAAINVRA